MLDALDESSLRRVVAALRAAADRRALRAACRLGRRLVNEAVEELKVMHKYCIVLKLLQARECAAAMS